MVQPTRGRGRAHVSRNKNTDKKPGCGDSGSVISIQSLAESQKMLSLHDSIPASAKMPEDQVLWVNSRGEPKTRQVIGERVLIRQQPCGPPVQPEILLLSDQMMAEMPVPDKYFQVKIMPGYGLSDYINDISDSMIDLNFPYIIVFLGTMQLRIFDSQVVKQQVVELVRLVNQMTPNSLIVFSGLVPRTVGS